MSCRFGGRGYWRLTIEGEVIFAVWDPPQSRGRMDYQSCSMNFELKARCCKVLMSVSLVLSMTTDEMPWAEGAFGVSAENRRE